MNNAYTLPAYPVPMSVGGLRFNVHEYDRLLNVTHDQFTGWWDSPDLEVDSSPRSTGHGSFVSDGRSPSRMVSLGGTAYCDTEEAAVRTRQELAAMLAGGAAGVLTVEDPREPVQQAAVRRVGKPLIDWYMPGVIRFQFTFLAADPRKYGLPVSAVTGVPKEGGGLVYDLYAGAPFTEVRRNLMINPVPASTADYFAHGDMVMVAEGLKVTENAAGGTLYVGPDFQNCRVGDIWYWTFEAKVVGNTTLDMRGRILAYDGATVTESSFATTAQTAADGFVRHHLWATVTAAAADGSSRVHPWAYPTNSGVPVGDGFILRNALITKVSAVGATVPYFDGNTIGTGDHVYSWAGTPHASQSIQSSTDGDEGVLDYGNAGDSGTVSFFNNGTADSAAVLRVDGYAPGFTITELGTGNRLVYTGTVPTGSHVILDPRDGSVLLDGTADRSTALAVREWTRTPPKGTSVFLFESAGPNAKLTVEGVPAWW